MADPGRATYFIKGAEWSVIPLIIHVVKPGESIYSISRIYQVPEQKIIQDNELPNPQQLVIGQALVILTDNLEYTVQPGDSLYLIALKYQMKISELIRVNPQISNPAALQPGQKINIPNRNIFFGPTEVNGYAFPNINRETLQRTLPYLTYLSIFSYHVSADGSLNTIDDQPLINAARGAQVAPLMVISNIEGDSGGFSSDIASQFLSNSAAQDRLIDNVITILKNKNYFGLDIDFEYIYPQDRENSNRFLRKVVSRLRPLGYTITTALAPKTSATQSGTLYEAHDYPVHGELMDHVILMTYEWGYTYSPPRAVAPINEVRKVLNYAVTEIPRQKILMGIPNYGYNWTLPFQQGTAATAISNTGAVQLALQVGANIQYDPISQAPYFRYYSSDGKQHEVWFEDARSILAKLTLANEFKLGGVSYWPIMQFFPQNWLVLNSVHNVIKKL